MLLEAEFVAEDKPLILTVCRLFLLVVDCTVIGAFVRDIILLPDGLFD